MGLLRLLCVIVAPIVLAGCAAATDLMATMRNDRMDLTDGPAFDQSAETAIVQDAIALEDRIRDIMRAAHGQPGQGRCSAAKLDDPAMVGCDEAALKGHWVGRLTGGGTIDAEAVTPSIAAAQSQMDRVTAGLRVMLDAQKQELTALRTDAASDDGYTDLRLTEMKQARGAISDALFLAGQRSAKTRRYLENARNEGQPELAPSLDALRAIEGRAKTLSEVLNAG